MTTIENGENAPGTPTIRGLESVAWSQGGDNGDMKPSFAVYVCDLPTPRWKQWWRKLWRKYPYDRAIRYWE